jgi:predicted membrane protein
MASNFHYIGMLLTPAIFIYITYLVIAGVMKKFEKKLKNEEKTDEV